MEDVKDINKTYSKDTNLTAKHSAGETFDYGGIVLIHKKTEKVVAALFLVTDYLSDSNPIRHKVRNLGVDLVSFIISDRRSATGLDGVSFVREYASRLLEITSLLEVAFLSEQISEMNFRIIGSEIERLILTVERVGKQSEYSPENSRISNVFTHGSSGDKLSGGMTASGKLRQRVFGKGHIYKQKKQERDVSPSRLSDTGMTRLNSRSHDLKKDRKSIIIKTLSGGKKMGVKDLIPVLNDVGEKTIQRELLALVSNGVLKKEGERRWSRYYLSDTPITPTLNSSNSVT